MSALPETVVTGGGAFSLRRAGRELWAYRDTVLAFAERNVRVKYKQTLLGALWVVLQPLAFMVVFTVALGRLADVPSAGTTYEAFSLSAFVSWSFVQNAVTQGANSLVADAAFLRKVYFPREVPVIAAQLSAAVDFGVGLLVFFVLGPILGADDRRDLAARTAAVRRPVRDWRAARRCCWPGSTSTTGTSATRCRS